MKKKCQGIIRIHTNILLKVLKKVQTYIDLNLHIYN